MNKSKTRLLGKQEKLFGEANDSNLVLGANRIIELREEKKNIKKKLEMQENNLIGLMQKAKKEKIRHGGYLIQIKFSEAKSKILLKQENTPETLRQKEKLTKTVPQNGTRESEN